MRRGERSYWEESRGAYSHSCPGVFSFPGLLTSDQLDALFLLRRSCYVSASRGEGCSLSHSRAMVLGIPMAATRTGALPELCCAASHVALCAPADVAPLVSEIRRMMTGLGEGTLAVDASLVDSWRQLFSLSRERREGGGIFGKLFGRHSRIGLAAIMFYSCDGIERLSKAKGPAVLTGAE